MFIKYEKNTKYPIISSLNLNKGSLIWMSNFYQVNESAAISGKQQKPCLSITLIMLFKKGKRLNIKDKLHVLHFLEERLDEENLTWQSIAKSDEFKKIRPFLDKRTLSILGKEPQRSDAYLNGKKAIKKTLLRAEVNLLKQKWGIDQ